MRIKIFLLFIVFAILLAVSDILVSQKNVKDSLGIKEGSQKSVTTNRNKYVVNIRYLKNKNIFEVDEDIFCNLNRIKKLDSFYLNIPQKYLDDYTQIASYEFRINSIKLNGNKLDYESQNRNEKGFVKNSLIKFTLPKNIDSTLHFSVKYKILFPKGRDIFNEEFYSFENWLVTIPFNSTINEIFPIHKYLETFLDFSDYKVTITLPEDYQIATTGKVTKETKQANNLYTCTANNVRCFNWFAFSNLVTKSKRIKTDKSKVDVTVFIDENKDGYFERYFESVEKYLLSMEVYNSFPYERLNILDLPLTSLDNKSYPEIIAIKSDLISPKKTLKLENDFAHLFAEQYFGNAINSSRIKEEWLSKGISRFVGEKLLRNNFGEPISYFKIADYYPVYGLLFMDYFGIPLIYTIGETEIPRGASNINAYYNNPNFGDISNISYKYPDKETLNIVSDIKTNLSLITFENFLGKEEFEKRFNNYVKSQWMKNTKSYEFEENMTLGIKDKFKKLYTELFLSDKKFDYAVKSIEKREGDLYDIIVVRNEDGIIPIELHVEAEDTTLIRKWNGVEKYHVFTIRSNSPIISAKLDYNDKNVLDLFYSNNSYTVQKKYWGSFSYATRVFFWFQNALMIIGGAV